MENSVILKLIADLGRWILNILFHLGRYTQLLWRAFAGAIVPPLRIRNFFKQLEVVGVNSLPVVILTGLFTGCVFTLQIIYGFRQFGAESMVGPTAAIAMTRELGPVLTALMVAGRVGSAMAAELGAMRVSEQIDALTVMAADPIKYLISHRIAAGIIMLPLLVLVADFFGIWGGYLVAIAKGVDPGQFVGKIEDILRFSDLANGLIKSILFGLILTSIGCYMGFYTKGGAEGVGESTTKAVVISSLIILLSDFFMTSIMF